MASEDDGKGDASIQGIYWREEILQLMFWLRGKGSGRMWPPTISGAFSIPIPAP
jgi:hypothetical protein